MRRLALSAFIIFLSLPLQAEAVSLAGHFTDESVCDLTPSTSYNLAKMVLFVEAGTFNESEIYSRIALRYVTRNCKNGQILLMHSDYGDPLDQSFFRNVSSILCPPDKVSREPTATSEAPASFQLRCQITKIQEATNYLADVERRNSTEKMIEEGAPIHARNNPETKQDNKEKCGGKLTFGELFLGLGGHCQ